MRITDEPAQDGGGSKCSTQRAAACLRFLAPRLRHVCAPMLALIVLLYPADMSARSGSRVEYLGGTRPDIPTGRSGEIRLSDNTYFVYLTRKTEVRIPYERINL